MARVVTETNAGTLEFTEELVDPDADALTLDELILYSINGSTVSEAQQNPSWLSYQSFQSSISEGTLLEVFITINAGGLSLGNHYRFRLTGSDPFSERIRFVTLEARTS